MQSAMSVSSKRNRVKQKNKFVFNLFEQITVCSNNCLFEQRVICLNKQLKHYFSMSSLGLRNLLKPLVKSGDDLKMSPYIAY